MRIRFLLPAALVGLLLFSTHDAAQAADAPAPAAKPEVWLCLGDRLSELLRPDAEWPFTKQHIAGIKLYVGQFTGGRRQADGAVPERLRQLARLVRENGYQVAVELGGCLDFGPMDDTNGEWSAQRELAAIDKFYAVGGKVDYLDIDGPIRRLMHPEGRRDGRKFDSMEKAADEVVDAVRIFHKAHPEIRFWHLTNFPNWGYKGDVSYHARGPKRQDYGEYDDAHRWVYEKLKAAGIPLSGVTIDNPYEYLLGEHFSVQLKDPKSVNWLRRVRDYEDRCRAEGLEVNLIVNSERGGQQSDELFFRETLRMVDTYLQAGGRPTRWFIQTWYPHPKAVVPETAPHTATALAKAVLQKVRSDLAGPTPTQSSVRPNAGETPPNAVETRRARARQQPSAAAIGSGRIALHPQPGAMQITARVPHLNHQAFALGIPETIGCREAMLVNFPEAKIEWRGPDDRGAVSCSWGPGGRISYTARLIPADDYVDLEMTVRNHTEFLWHEVFAFNCLNPVSAPAFLDWKLARTYMSTGGKPLCMATTQRMKGHMPTVGFYLPERIEPGKESIFVRGFGATSPNRTDDSWIVTLSEPAGAYMAAMVVDIAFLFDNLDRCCLHAAPSFGDIGPGEGSTTACRFYFANGSLEDFQKRCRKDKSALASRVKLARPIAAPATSQHAAATPPGKSKPHGRMEAMHPDDLEKVLTESPVAFVPLGTFEHHGWHLPVCFDGIKAHALCERVAARTGGAVLPTYYYGTGGGHVGYKWTLILPEKQIAPLLEATLDHLARQGFKVVVILTGHYPKEQVDMAHRLAAEAQTRHPKVRFIGLTEPEVTTKQLGDPGPGDHAAKYETSIAMALEPAWVRMDRLTEGRDPARVTLPDTPRGNASTHDPKHPLYAIHGKDPRTTASKALGEKLVAEIVARLSAQVEEALAPRATP